MNDEQTDKKQGCGCGCGHDAKAGDVVEQAKAADTGTAGVTNETHAEAVDNAEGEGMVNVVPGVEDDAADAKGGCGCGGHGHGGQGGCGCGGHGEVGGAGHGRGGCGCGGHAPEGELGLKARH